jgi:hypothetical protein
MTKPDLIGQVKLAVARHAGQQEASVMTPVKRQNPRIGPGCRTLYTDWKEVQKHRKTMTVKPRYPRRQGSQFPEYTKWLAAHPDIQKELSQ